MPQETWYVLVDGSSVHPSEVAPNDAGALLHKSGVAVAMRGQVPSTRGVDPEDERAKAQPKPKGRSKDMRPDESKAGYVTRETKAE